MRLSIRWLKQYLHLDLTVDEILHALIMGGLEVESEVDLGLKSGRIVVAQVLDVQPHPNADKLRLCQVNTGLESGPLKIVCGAPNVVPQMIVPCALEGAKLPDGIVIKKSKIRGEESFGMLCSGRELGLGVDHSGILELPETYVVGTPFDYLIDIKVTPNRPDCLSIIGVARDIAAMLRKKVFPPTPRVKEMLDQVDNYIKISVKARAECPRYAARLIRDVKVGPSPVWLKLALESCGLRSINNIVDVTNFVLLEFGHPLHAFDLDTLEGSEIVVRMANAAEKIVVIDGSEITLTEQDLVIADANKAIALAGVMGGKATQVTERTTNILLESAYFDPSTIRRTARCHKMQTDASYRFERGADRQRLLTALNRATQLMQEVAGGELARGIIDVHNNLPDPVPIILETKRLNSLLGTQLSSTEIADSLVNLGFEIRLSDRESMVVITPSHRIDIQRDVDLIEEVARVINYNNIPSTLPRVMHETKESSVALALPDKIRNILCSTGCFETVSYSFVSDELLTAMGYDPQKLPRIANPITVEQVVMRPTLIGSLLEICAHNQHQDEASIELFEIGKIWNENSVAADPAGEAQEVAIVCSGPVLSNWAASSRNIDFFDVKAKLELIMKSLRIESVSFEPLTDSPLFHPGRAARVVKRHEHQQLSLGEIGEIHPDVATYFDLRGRVYAARIDLELLFELAVKAPIQVQSLPRFPGSWRDLALVLDRSIPAIDVLNEAKRMAHPLVEEISIFDIYEGDRIPQDKKSLAIKLRLRSQSGTLTEDEISRQLDLVVKSLNTKFGAELRS